MKRRTKNKIAVYPGSFDPVTNGHIDVIMRAAPLFDGLVVAVIENPSKKPYFSSRDRVDMVRKALSAEGVMKLNPKTRVGSFKGLLVDYMKNTGSDVVIRGLRAVSDFEYEFQMAIMNRKLDRKIETVFLMTDERFSYLSSSLVREISSMGGDVSRFVPECVLKKIRGKK